MQKLLIVRSRFNGMTDGMTEVEDHAQARLALVLSDDIGFDANRCRNHAGQRSDFSCEHCIHVLLEITEESGIVDDSRFDRLLKSRAKLSRGQRAKQIGIGEDGLRMM